MGVTAPAAKRVRQKLFLDLPFSKAAPAPDGSGDLILSGYASTWTLDRDNEIVAPDAFSGSLQDYLTKNPVVLWQHDPHQPIGDVTNATTDETGLYVTVRVPNPGPDSADWQKGAYTSIKLGTVRTFSIGGYFTRDVEMGPDGPVFTIVEVELFEISCVSIPANSGALFEAVMKAYNGQGATMSTKAQSQLEQVLGVVKMTDPELVLMTEEARAERYEMLKELFVRCHGTEPPALTDWKTIISAEQAGLDPAKVIVAKLAFVQTLTSPEVVRVEQEAKAGRTVSAATRTKLEASLAGHKKMEDGLIEAATAMTDVAKAHKESSDAIKGILGVTDEGDADGTEDEDEEADETTPTAKPSKAAAGKKQCPVCKGTGKIRGNSIKCPTCNGSGEVSEDYDPDKALLDILEKQVDGTEVATALQETQDEILKELRGKAGEAARKQLMSNLQQSLQSAGNDALGKAGSGGADMNDEEDDYVYVYVDDFDVDSNWVVYCCYGPGSTDRFVKVSYTRNMDGSVTLGSDQTPVQPSRGYVPKALAFMDASGRLRFPDDSAKQAHQTALAESKEATG